jgi:uncharacterized lipoprotein YddW (UPF0748 family)
VRFVALASLALMACASTSDQGATESTSAVEVDGAMVDVRHERELRGAWVSSVFNGTWPSRTGLSATAMQKELVDLFDVMAGAGMNAVFLQVRPESDALYASQLEPWSRFLSGTQGGDPGFDPLAFAVAEAHRRGLELHAWINPYRGMATATATTAPGHVTKTMPESTLRYGSLLWMDPGADAVQKHILDVVRDIVSRYDIDGIHFDDYFYPYPVEGTAFPDDATFAAYQTGGGALARDDWRRSNVDTLVQRTSEAIAALRPDVRFGISPFGIYRPGIPQGIAGLDAYATLYCDPVKWMDQGWVDYLIPQLYWPTTRPAQSFDKLVAWWAGLAKNGRTIFVGHEATKAGTAEFPLEEYERQMVSTRAQRPHVMGSVFFSAKPLMTDTAGLRTALASKYWSKPALTPALAGATSGVPAPGIARHGAEVEVTGQGRAVLLYRHDGTGWSLTRVVPAAGATTRVTLEAGQSAISIADRRGVESQGVVVDVP